jgi:hypothetical protein
VKFSLHYSQFIILKYILAFLEINFNIIPPPYTHTHTHPITAKLLDFVHRPDFYKPENTTFRKLELFPSSGEGGAPTLQKNQKLSFPQAMPEQKKVNHWKLFPRLKTETDPVSETLCFLVCRNPDDGQSPEA